MEDRGLSVAIEGYKPEIQRLCFTKLRSDGWESGAVALVTEHDAKPWLIGFGLRLLTAAYSKQTKLMLAIMFLCSEILAIELILMQGIMCSGIAYNIQGMVMKERGPVFVTAFNPLISSGIESGYTNLSEIDRVVGATIIVIGFYSLKWGKRKDYLTHSSDDDEKKGAFELPFSATDAMKSNSADHATVAEIPSAKSP
ncbi:WAT1-related protein At1g21890-like [Elaeis guineensis]|uniref:WAT1-related protein At1g21890-like n=1 Tax=Elaeis guineensis var. tenera TaxID=51953 RepID=UPI003C6D22A5